MTRNTISFDIWPLVSADIIWSMRTRSSSARETVPTSTTPHLPTNIDFLGCQDLDLNIPGRFRIISSIMRQKKNAVGPRKLACISRMLSCVVTLYHALKGTTGLAIPEWHYGLETLWRVGNNLARYPDCFCQLCRNP
jgi:hypothetical protein